MIGLSDVIYDGVVGLKDDIQEVVDLRCDFRW